MSDYLSKEFYEEMKAEVKTRVSEKRFEHIKSVAKTAKQLGEVYGCDAQKCRLAGILHDWDKGLSNEEEIAKAKKYHLDGEISEFVINEMPQLLHGPTAAAELHERFANFPEDVLHAIDVHTTACLEMNDLDMILYIADAIEPTRQYPELEEITSMVGKVSLFELYFTVYCYWTIRLLQRKKALYPATIEIYNNLVAQRG